RRGVRGTNPPVISMSEYQTTDAQAEYYQSLTRDVFNSVYVSGVPPQTSTVGETRGHTVPVPVVAVPLKEENREREREDEEGEGCSEGSDSMDEMDEDMEAQRLERERERQRVERHLIDGARDRVRRGEGQKGQEGGQVECLKGKGEFRLSNVPSPIGDSMCVYLLDSVMPGEDLNAYTKVHITGCVFEDTGAAAVTYILRGMTRLAEVSISDCYFSSAAGRSLVAVLCGSKNLAKLSLCSNRIRDTEAETLYTTLVQRQPWVGCAVGTSLPRGSVCGSMALQGHSLATLLARYVEGADEGEAFMPLTKLRVSGFEYGPLTSMPILSVLTSWPRLVELDLSSNNLSDSRYTDRDMATLVNVIQGLPNMQKLVLSGNILEKALLDVDTPLYKAVSERQTPILVVSDGLYLGRPVALRWKARRPKYLSTRHPPILVFIVCPALDGECGMRPLLDGIKEMQTIGKVSVGTLWTDSDRAHLANRLHTADDQGISWTHVHVRVTERDFRSLRDGDLSSLFVLSERGVQRSTGFERQCVRVSKGTPISSAEFEHCPVKRQCQKQKVKGPDVKR
ncbi:hypothetical protein KIPB_005068, partial [Kipferlia bialata]